MKKVLKIVMILIMLSGIVFSVFNFTSAKTKAAAKDGRYTYWPDGTIKDCEDIGKQCVIGDFKW